jgi:hypothetical protein
MAGVALYVMAHLGHPEVSIHSIGTLNMDNGDIPCQAQNQAFKFAEMVALLKL